ncbi:MAG TPA: hypothetical protein O0X23_02080 [Methanocorpusculum sp.]|nr:hypothetical protein [Methanocorpusculum sp.]
MSVWRDGKILFARCGEVILDAARWMWAGDLIMIAFSPQKVKKLDVLIQTACIASGKKQVQNLLGGAGWRSV